MQALTTVTLVAGFASTLFAPLTAVLDDRFGWRPTYLILAAILTIAVPLHWWGLHLVVIGRVRRRPSGGLPSMTTTVAA